MALIGSIAISMVARTDKLVKGLGYASQALRKFEGGAVGDMRHGLSLIQEGFAGVPLAAKLMGDYVGPAVQAAVAKSQRGLAGLASSMSNTVDVAAFAVRAAASKFGPAFAPIGYAAMASVESVRYTLGLVSGPMANGLRKSLAPAAMAAIASISSLDYVFGGMARSIASKVSPAFALFAGRSAFLKSSLSVSGMAVGKLAGGFGMLGRSALRAGGAGLKSLAGGLGSVAGAAARSVPALLAVGATASFSLGKAVQAAAAFSDSIAGSKALLGQSSSLIVAQANKEAVAFGQSRTAFIESATTFASMMSGASKSSDDAAKLGMSLVSLGRDMASIKHLSQGEAFTAIGAALRGEFDPIERFGIFLKADAIAAKAVSMGLAATAKDATDAAKKQAAYTMILEQSTKMQGFFASQADRASSGIESLWGRVENLLASVGTGLLPIAGEALNQVNVAVQALSLAWGDSGNAALNATGTTVNGVGVQAGSIGFLQQSIGFASNAWQLFGEAFKAVQSLVTSGLAYITGGLSKLAMGLEYLTGASSTVSDALSNISSNLHKLSGEQWTEFKSKMQEPWNSNAVDDYFAKARQNIADMRKQLSGPGAMGEFAARSLVGGIDKAKKEKLAKPDTLRFSSAMSAGSTEATNTILKSRYGTNQANKPSEQTARNTAELVRIMNGMPSKIGQSIGQSLGSLAGAAFGSF